MSWSQNSDSSQYFVNLVTLKDCQVKEYKFRLLQNQFIVNWTIIRKEWTLFLFVSSF